MVGKWTGDWSLPPSPLSRRDGANDRGRMKLMSEVIKRFQIVEGLQ